MITKVNFREKREISEQKREISEQKREISVFRREKREISARKVFFSRFIYFNLRKTFSL